MQGKAINLNAEPSDPSRLMSRRAALDSIGKPARDAYLKKHGATLLGGGLDESPQAYKPITQVIAAQRDLVDVLGSFTPRIVRMADEAEEF